MIQIILKMGNVTENMSTSILSLKTLLEFTSFSVPLILTQLCTDLPDIICYIILGSLGDADATAVYGLSWTFFNMFCFCILISVGEIAGAGCSKAFGAQNYRKMASYFYKSCLLIAFMLLVYFLFCQQTEEILLLVNIPAEIAFRAGKYIRLAYWQNCLIGLNLIIQNFLIAQNIIRPLNCLNVINIVLTVFLARHFIVDKELKEFGIVYVKLLQEGFCLLFLAAVQIFVGEKKAFISPSFSLVAENFRGFLRKNFYAFLGMYGEFLAFELNTLIVAQLKDVDKIAAWLTYSNIFALIMCTALGIGYTFRTRIGYLIGEGWVVVGRKKSIAYFCYSIICAIAYAIPLFIFSSSIARIFIDNEKIASYVANCLKILSFNCPAVFCIFFFFTIFRVLNMENYMFKMVAFVFPTISLLCSAFLSLELGFGLPGVAFAQLLCYNGIVVIFFRKVYWQTSWELNCKQDEKLEYKDLS